jgi:hypothetical protein
MASIRNTPASAPDPVAASARPLGPAEDLIGAQPGETGDHLGKPEALAIGLFAQVGPEHGKRAIADAAVGIELGAQRRREVVGRGAVDDDRDHGAIGMARAEQPHLLVDRGPRRGHRRANHDQDRRGIERRDGGVGQRVAAGEILAITKDRPQRLRHRPHRRVAADHVLVEAVAFQRLVQPPRPRGVAMAVAQERAVADRSRIGHDRSSQRRSNAEELRWRIRTIPAAGAGNGRDVKKVYDTAAG